VAVTETLAERLTRRDNDYTSHVAQIVTTTGLGWHDRTPPEAAAGRSLSVVIPAHNNAYSLPTVLDALRRQQTHGRVEVIVVDDASTDDTAAIAAAHSVTSSVIALRRRSGSGAARNVGTIAARAATVVFLDADMVLPPHVLADLAVRAHPQLVLVGFRHNLPYQPDTTGRGLVPPGEPDLAADHRVIWRPPVGTRLFYTGLVLGRPIDGRPLDHTGEFLRLGNGRRYYDWDLPRMVVTALVAAPRAAVIAAGGFHPDFAHGWGCDDTYLGAVLIADGCKVVPLRQARGWHIDPPDAERCWRAKFATAADNVARYWRLLNQPADARHPLTASPDVARLLAEGRRLK
jgi:glycosyltransferase involved in cell wall biosynthesis